MTMSTTPTRMTATPIRPPPNVMPRTNVRPAPTSAMRIATPTVASRTMSGRARKNLWVMARQVRGVAAVPEPEADDQADAGDQQQQADADRERVDVERVLRELALAGLEQRGGHVDRSFVQARHDRHLLARPKLAGRDVVDRARGVVARAGFGRSGGSLIARGPLVRAGRDEDSCADLLLGHRPECAVDVPEKLVMLGE